MLSQLSLAVSRLDDAQFTHPIPVLSNACIGQHVRHIIEMFRSLEAGYVSGRVNYEERERNIKYETDRKAAIGALEDIGRGLDKDDRELVLEGHYHPDEPGLMRFKTNYQREVIYNLEHAIHHMAMIRIGLQELGTAAVPEDFGIAAATVKYRNTCAR